MIEKVQKVKKGEKWITETIKKWIRKEVDKEGTESHEEKVRANREKG